MEGRKSVIFTVYNRLDAGHSLFGGKAQYFSNFFLGYSQTRLPKFCRLQHPLVLRVRQDH